MLYTEQHRELMRSVTRFVEAEIDPHAEEWEAAGISRRTSCSGRWASGPARRQQARSVRRQGLDYSYQIASPRRSDCELRRRPDGDRRADRHGDARAASWGSDELRDEFLAPAIAGETSPASPSRRPAPAPTSPRSRPPRARTATTTSSTARRCGSPTPRRPTGCACSSTPATARRTATRR